MNLGISIIWGRYKKIIVAFILIVLLFALGGIVVPNFLTVEQVLLTL